MPIVNTNIAETINIKENGQHDVAKYTTANVSVAGIPRTVDANGVLQLPTTIPSDLLSGATDVGDYVLDSVFYITSQGYVPNFTAGSINLSSLTAISGNYACCRMFSKALTNATSVDLSSLTTISGDHACYYMFERCTGLTSVDLSNLTTVSASSACSYMFSGCTGLTSVDLSNLTTVSASSACAQMFSGCTGITSVDLSNLTTVSGMNGCANMFYGCTGLTSIDLSSLATVSGGQKVCANMFRNCISLTTLSFPALTSTSFGSYINPFNNMLQGVTGCTVHFPSNLQSVIGSWSDVTAGFGGIDTTVLFDLAETE